MFGVICVSRYCFVWQGLLDIIVCDNTKTSHNLITQADWAVISSDAESSSSSALDDEDGGDKKSHVDGLAVEAQVADVLQCALCPAMSDKDCCF